MVKMRDTDTRFYESGQFFLCQVEAFRSEALPALCLPDSLIRNNEQLKLHTPISFTILDEFLHRSPRFDNRNTVGFHDRVFRIGSVNQPGG